VVAAASFFLFTWIILGIGLSPLDWRTWSSFAGVRFFPGVFYYFAPAWWFVGLILQLYLVFPFLLKILNRMPAVRFFIVIGGAAILIRTAGLFYFDRYLDAWSRGACFLSRLPEFAFGMAFAKMLVSDPQRVMRHAGNVRSVLWGASAYILGTITSFTLLGMSVAFLLTSAGFFILVFAAASKSQGLWQTRAAWPGRHVYALFLVHHPVILFWVPASLPLEDLSGVFFYLFSAAAISVLGAMALEAAASWGLGRIRKGRGNVKKGGSGLFRRIAAAALAAYGIALAGEAFLRSFDPQEVYGWGERAALVPDELFGYRLKPDTVTRLRWESYDYVVQSNALGFPGPLYPVERKEGTFRIIVTGDAFTSAEGVNTGESWPRLLEARLEKTGIQTEILNFAVTGWGPNQYEAVIRKYAPVYRPDLILIGFFVNDFFDVWKTKAYFQDVIGFDKPKQQGFASFLRLSHVTRFCYRKIIGRIREFVLQEPYPFGYFIGNLSFFEKANLAELRRSMPLVEDRLKSIQTLAKRIEAEVVLLLIPAPILICPPDKLEYFPAVLDLSDDSRFDMDQPQRLIVEISEKLNVSILDPRKALRDSAVSPCQPRNMHFNRHGHEVVSAFLSRKLENKLHRKRKGP